jgi:hypothetical protein
MITVFPVKNRSRATTDPPAVGRVHHSAGRAQKICAAMGAADFAVEHAPRAKSAVRRIRHSFGLHSGGCPPPAASVYLDQEFMR